MTKRSRYGLRFAQTLVPLHCVEVTRISYAAPVADRLQALVWEQDDVVARRYGFTAKHAMNRALAWTRQHGDPR
jgi:hypothetical protein